MDPTLFRRDRFLRSSGYLLGTWAVVNSLFSIPAYAAATLHPWSAGALSVYSVLLIAVGIVVSLLHERRLGKMLGACEGTPIFSADKLWGPLILTGFCTMAALIFFDLAQYVQPLWLVVVGGAYLVWGLAAFRPYALLGAALLVAGLGVGSMQQAVGGAPPSLIGLHLWNLTMGAVAMATALWVNRNFLWLK
ncbi:MAG: hypothetical protein ACE5E4_01105 [Candidatus Binatia bacterium]